MVTGASSGIGEALARLLVAEGHEVTAVARRAARLERLQNELGERLIPVICDLESQTSVNRLRRLSRQDVVVVNAGRGLTRMPLETSPEDVASMISANVVTAMNTFQALLPAMLEAGQGHFIFIGSILGRVPYAPWRAAYSASKAALLALVAGYRQELSATGIALSVVNPGLTTTEFQQAANPGSISTPRLSTRAASFPSAQRQSAEQVATHIAKVIDSRKDEAYTRQETANWMAEYYAGLAQGEDSIRDLLSKP